MNKIRKNKYISEEVMKIRRDNLSKLIDSAISDIDKEIDLHNSGLDAESTVSTLLQIKQQLFAMKNSMSPKKYVPTFGYIIVDSWDMYSKLGEKLLRIKHDYNEKLD